MSIINIEHLSFGYDSQGTELFQDVTLNLQSEWKLGLIGRNGRGKTTFLKLLQEKLLYQGKIQHGLNFTYFPQKVLDPQQLTYYVLEELSDFQQWKIERELNLLQVDPEILWRPFHSLSGGEQTKVLLALLFVDDINFPLIDEPTNHLDIVARDQVATYLRQKKQGFILVSHDRKFVDEVVDHILSIEKSQLILYQGNFSIYEEQKRLRDQTELAENEKLKREIGRLKKTAAEKAQWSQNREQDKVKGKGFIDTELRRVNKGAVGADAARTMKRAKAIVGRMESQIADKEKLLKNLETVDPLKMNFVPSHHQRLLQVTQLQLKYERPLFQPISFELKQGQRIAIQGANGSGKSSIINYLLGTFSGTATGEISRPEKLTISYVRQNYEDNQGTLAEFAEANRVPYEDLLNNLRKLGVERRVFTTPIEKMSMGQKKRVEIAKSLAQPAELYIWDEPLNYLDVFNQEQLETVIRQVKPTMLIVEHDRAFLENVATEILQLEKPSC